jgi:hypothetical protein
VLRALHTGSMMSTPRWSATQRPGAESNSLCKKHRSASVTTTVVDGVGEHRPGCHKAECAAWALEAVKRRRESCERDGDGRT